MRIYKPLFLLLLLIPYATFSSSPKRVLVRNELNIKDNNEGFYKSVSDIIVYNDFIFLSDFSSSQVLKFSYLHNADFLGFLGRKGQGPGDIQKPIKLSADKNTIAIRDQLGVSFFNIQGKYLNSFRLYEPVSGSLLWNGLYYCLSIGSNNPDLIDVYDLAGQHKYSFGKKTISASPGMGSSDPFYELLFYDGDLLSDGDHLFYANKRTGMLYKYSFKGDLISETSIAPFFGNNGIEKVKWNKNNLFNNADLDKFKAGAIRPKNIYLHAVLDNKTIYFLSDQHNVLTNKPTFQVDIKAVSTANVALTDTFQASLEVGEWFDAFSAKFIRNKLVFLLSIRFKGDLTLYEYYPTEKTN